MSQQILEPTPTAAKPPGRLRWIAALVGLAAVAAIVVSAETYRGIQMADADIKAAGGTVMFLPTFSQVMRQRWMGEPFENQTYVFLHGSLIDGAWLRSRDNLSELQIDGLHIDQTALTADQTAGFVKAHPLSEIVVMDVPGTNELAAALAAIPTLTRLNLAGSDLTDAGFRQLPLEQLHELRIARTSVTPAVLLELRRCRELQRLVLDGRQIDADVVGVLKDLPNIEHLTLSGDAVTDETLQLLHGINLRTIGLLETSTTKAGIALLKTNTSGCRIDVGDRHVFN